MFDFDKTKKYSIDQLIKYQRLLIARCNLMHNNIPDGEFLKRQKEYNEFTEWLYQWCIDNNVFY